ncbi:MAG: putative membrane protein YedE/YeeE [Ascidiaceihabitans sp.]|jgi:uncharacterized membrane protein YedE/YeeE
MPMDWIMGLVGGLLIGLAGAIYLLGNGRVMGASGIIGGLVDRSAGGAWPERLAFLGALVAVPAVLQVGMPVDTATAQAPVLLILAGICVGIGTRIANGCTSGHGVCGISRLSPRGIVATLVYIGAGALTVLALRLVLGGL